MSYKTTTATTVTNIYKVFATTVKAARGAGGKEEAKKRAREGAKEKTKGKARGGGKGAKRAAKKAAKAETREGARGASY